MKYQSDWIEAIQLTKGTNLERNILFLFQTEIQKSYSRNISKSTEIVMNGDPNSLIFMVQVNGIEFSRTKDKSGDIPNCCTFHIQSKCSVQILEQLPLET